MINIAYFQKIKNMNKNIWITGASSGIGKSLAIKFANEGWQVAASARRENLLKELSNKYQNICSFPLDVTDSEKCKFVFKDIIEKYKDIEICVFGTGIHDPKSEKKLNLEKIRKIMEVNFFGTINSINCIIDYYKEKKSGQISIVSSVAGYRGLPAAGAYCASKSALSSFAESLYFDMKKDGIKAIKIFDNAAKSTFLVGLRLNKRIEFKTFVPKDVENFLTIKKPINIISDDSMDRIGYITLYYDESIIINQINKLKAKTKKEIENFNQEINMQKEKANKIKLYINIGSLVIILFLIYILLMYFVNKPLQIVQAGLDNFFLFL